MLSASDTKNPPSTIIVVDCTGGENTGVRIDRNAANIDGIALHFKRPQVFLYASQVYYRREEDGAVFSAHIDDLDDPGLDIKACGEGVVVPSGATPYNPSDADDDDALGEWLDRCDAVDAVLV